LEKFLWIFQVLSKVLLTLTGQNVCRAMTSDSFVFKTYRVPFDKGGLRTKHLRKYSTAEEGVVAEEVQLILHEELSRHFSARSGSATKSLNFPAIQPGSCTPSRFPTTCTSLYGQGTPVAPVIDFTILVSPPASSKFLTSTP